MSTSKSNFWSSPLTKSRITSDDVKMPEMLLGYFIGPFGALLSSGIFTSILQNYFTDVLKLDLGFLTTFFLTVTVFFAITLFCYYLVAFFLFATVFLRPLRVRALFLVL